MRLVEKAAFAACRGTAALCLAVVPMVPALADSPPDAAAAQTTARAFAIPAQPLPSALIQFSEETGIQLFFDASIARGIQSPGANGTMTPQEALARLLSGTGLTFRFTNATTVTLQRATAANDAGSAVVLEPVVVQGQRPETAYGPVQGFVARRSTTATKTDTALLETPQSITVVGRDQMQTQNAQSVTDAIHYTPGAGYSGGTVDTRFDTINIRGFVAPLYLDGMLLPSGSSQFGRTRPDPFGLERVEILRGPSAALYGQIPPGGMVNLISLRPTDQPVHTVQLQGTSFGQLQGAADIGGPITEDGQFLYRLTGLVHGGGTQIDHVDDNRVMIQPAFTWRPDIDTTLTVLGQFQRDVNGVATQFLPAQGSLLPNPNGTLPMSAFLGDPNDNSYQRTQFWAGYLFEHHVNDAITLRQKLRYASVDTNLGAVIASSLQANLTTVNRVAYSVPESAQNVTIENEAQVKFVTGPLIHTALFGFDYMYAGSQTKQGIGPAPPLNMFQPVYWQPITTPTITTSTAQRQNQYGVYLQDQIALDHWRLTLSGRHDWVDTTTQNYIANTQASQAVSAFSGRAGLNYVFDFGLSPYVSYATSFQPTIGTTFSGTPFQPTQGQQFEVGVKYEPNNENISASLAAYKLVQNNALTTDALHPGFSVQSGQVTAQGIEFGAQATLAKGFDIVAAYTFTDAKITQSNGADLGSQVAAVPQHQGSLWSDFVIQQGPLRGLGFGAGFRYVGWSWGNAPNTLLIPGYVLIDSMISYDLGELHPKLDGAKLVLNANNVMDTRYVTTCSSATACFYGAERQVTLTMRYSW
jgi:iron complex outermembrane recepter protein